jgi:hypothetical protein
MMNSGRFESMMAGFRMLRQRRRRKRRERISGFLSVWEERFPPSEIGPQKPPKPSRAGRPERIELFLTEWGAAWEDIKPPADFNTFSLLRRARDEVIHTQFLAWLFDRHGDHGQRHMFMAALLDLCGLPPQDGWKRGYVVRPEFSRAEAQIDIMIARRFDFLIYIENKIDAGEQRGQIDREFRDMRCTGRVMHVPEERQIAVFLTKRGRNPTSGDADRWPGARGHRRSQRLWLQQVPPFP